MGNKKDSLGDRHKFYERQYAGLKLMPLLPVVCRLDGKAFHSFTKGLRRPYDERLSSLMVETTKYIMAETNANIAYTQSDEISLIWYTEKLDTMLFFDSKLLKMNSILSAMTSVFFNKNLNRFLPEKSHCNPVFDSRVWNVPTLGEASLYLLWREQDATRNSISMAAQAYYSHKELMGKSSKMKQEMLFSKGVNWNDYPAFFKRGTYIQKRTITRPYTNEELSKLPERHEVFRNPSLKFTRSEIMSLELPPLKTISNRSAVLFDNADVELFS